MWICSPHLYCSDPLLLLSLISCGLQLPFRQQMSNKTIDEWNIPISSYYFDSTSRFSPEYELIYKPARGVMSWSCSYSCCRVSSVFSSGRAATHWSAGGNINQCGEQSAHSLIQSPLQQNAAIRTTEACKCVFVCCCVRLICLHAGPYASHSAAATPTTRNKPLYRGKTEWIETIMEMSAV